MKRHLRNLAFFLLGFFGVAVFMLARAETVAATATTTYLVDNSKIYGCTGWSTTAISPAAVCASSSTAHLGVYNGNASCLTSSNGFICSITASCSSGYTRDSVSGECRKPTTTYSCPDSSWALNGTTCTRPDCATGYIRQSDGTCKNNCTTTANQKQSFFYRTATNPIGRTFCIPETGCEGIVSQATPQYDCGTGDILVCYQGFQVTAMSTPSPCSSSTSSLPAASSPVPANKPPCSGDQGVLTSSSGKVACVPSGTPSATPPKIGTKTSTTQGADGSTTINNTTTTCTGEGACSSTTTTTVTSSAGQSQTTSKTTDSNSVNGGTNSVGATGGGGGGGDAGCDPTVQMCISPDTSGLYTKKQETFAGPLSRFSDGVKTSVLGGSASGFFNVTVSSGSCPQWSGAWSVMGAQFTVDTSTIFCSSDALKIMDMAGVVLMAVAALAAFKWAIL